jgi:hypothetical protein
LRKQKVLKFLFMPSGLEQRQMVTALRRVSEASFKSTNRGIEKKRFFSMPLINESR